MCETSGTATSTANDDGGMGATHLAIASATVFLLGRLVAVAGLAGRPSAG